MTFKVAPMCSKVHTIGNSVKRFVFPWFFLVFNFCKKSPTGSNQTQSQKSKNDLIIYQNNFCSIRNELENTK